MLNLRSFATAALLASAALAQCPSLTTLTTAGNGQNGTMFEIHNVSTSPMMINSFDQCFFTAGTDNMEIYTMAGSCAGFELNSASWTLVGSATGFTHGVAPALDAVPIPVNVLIGPGQTQSFYVTTLLGTAAYTTGVAQYGAVIGSDANIQVIARTGMSYPFGSGFGLPSDGRLWNGTVQYCPSGSGTVFATATNFGTGCVQQYASFYEYFLPSTTIDLSNTSFQMIPSGGGYVIVPASVPFAAPGAGATNLALGDDTTVNRPISTTFNFPGGSTTSFDVCSNGMISAGGSNGTSYQPSVSAFLNWALPAWTVWRDFICTAGGNVWFEEVGGVVTFTWYQVIGYQGTANGTVTSDFNVIFDTNTGIVTFAFGSMDNVSLSTWTGGDGYIVGYSPGGASADPGNKDLSTALPLTLSGSDNSGLALAAGARPIQNTSVAMTTSNITPAAAFGGLALGFSNPNLNLAIYGMPGCTQYADHVAVLLFFPLGQPTASVSFNVPAALNVVIKAQSFVYDPAAALTPLGAVASQGVDLLIGDF